MLEFLQKYPGTIKLNNQNVNKEDFVSSLNNCVGSVEIVLLPTNAVDTDTDSKKVSQISVYVKPWMLDKGTEDFNFMTTWNKDIPMPLRYMEGTIEKETSRMYYMKLHGEPTKVSVCSKCGRTLVNPTSKLVGIGPECCSKIGLDPKLFIQTENSKEIICQLEKHIRNIQWEGWVPKTAILNIQTIN